MSLKPKRIEKTVYEAALERFNLIFDRFDTPVVSFSGGKDSTVCLNLALEVAEQRGRLPLDVYFWDEECIHPTTIEYVERVAADPRIRFKWLCVPIQHRNACSRREPYWYPWAPEDRHKWVRELPPGAITHVDGFERGMTIPEITHRVYSRNYGTVADIRGIRADESLRRLQSVSKKERDNWIGAAKEGYNFPCSPIYDWTSFDVWTAPRLFGWDYNKTYDILEMMGVALAAQRVCPPFGEEPLANLWWYAQGWPEHWHKMLARVPGAATAARYSRSELYGFGNLTPPPGMTWRTWTFHQLDLYPERYKKIIAKNIATIIESHKKKTHRPIPEDQSDPMTGLSWKFLAMIANRADLKGRRKGKLVDRGIQAMKKTGLSMEDLIQMEEEAKDHGRY